jgi:hypothetical protein
MLFLAKMNSCGAVQFTTVYVIRSKKKYIKLKCCVCMPVILLLQAYEFSKPQIFAPGTIFMPAVKF